jgi:HAE1 family hydrophobic/amphiphilic exporter-1
MWLTDVSIRRPVTIIMLVLALIVLGLRSRSNLKTELNPQVDIPYVSISTVYPGAGPQEIELKVSKPIEDAVSTVNKVKNVESTSQEGVSVVVIEFYIGTDLDAAAADVRDKVGAAKQNLPSDALDPVVMKFDVAAMPILQLGVTSDRPSQELRVIVEDVIKDRFGKLPGVGDITITGGDTREIRISVDKGRLAAYGLGIGDVVGAIVSENLNMPAGSITEGPSEYSVRLIGEFGSVDEIRTLDIPYRDVRGQLHVVRMMDLGSVEDTVAKRQETTRVQGRDSIGLLVSKQSNANTVDVADAVKQEIASMKSDRLVPEDVEILVQSDDSKFVLEAIADVNTALVLGALFATIIVFIFLHNLRGTLIIALAIPTSIIATFLPMYAFGFTLNQMTMLALALVVGILVDDSIVVLENIFRHLGMGKSPKQAAYDGRSEIGLAAITITSVDVVVFVPIAFMGGIVGSFFRQFGITVAIATIFSLFVSFTLTPMLASRLYTKGFRVDVKGGFFAAFDRFYAGLDRAYRRVLAWAISNRYMTVSIGALSLLSLFAVMLSRKGILTPGGLVPRAAVNVFFSVIIGIVFLLGAFVAGRRNRKWMALLAGICLVLVWAVSAPLQTAFFPAIDQGQVSVSVEMPAGTALAETDRVVRMVEKVVGEIPEVDKTYAMSGRSSGGIVGVASTGTNYGSVSLALREKKGAVDILKGLVGLARKDLRKRSDVEIAAEIRRRLSGIPGADIKVATAAAMGEGGVQDIEIELLGNDIADLTLVSQRVLKVVSANPAVLNPDTSWRIGKPEVQASVDRVKAASLGFSVAQIATAVRNSVEGNTDSKYRTGGREYDIRIQLEEADRSSVDEIGSTVIGAVDSVPVTLRDVANIKMGSGPTKIERKNRQRRVKVVADLRPGYALGNVKAELTQELASVPLGSVTMQWGGLAEWMEESFGYLFSALFLSIILVYILMASLFESLLNPLVIMLSLPQAMIGALLALILTGKTLSIVSMIGFIMLMGLVTKNAILLIDYTNTLRSRGRKRDEAVLEAGPTRLRPVLMTTFAMIFGMLPVALALGRGSELRSPMAIAVIGGLILSTMLTLLVIPTLYTIADDIAAWLRRVFLRRRQNSIP